MFSNAFPRVNPTDYATLQLRSSSTLELLRATYEAHRPQTSIIVNKTNGNAHAPTANFTLWSGLTWLNFRS
jgi:hypothetical protein